MQKQRTYGFQQVLKETSTWLEAELFITENLASAYFIGKETPDGLCLFEIWNVEESYLLVHCSAIPGDC